MAIPTGESGRPEQKSVRERLTESIAAAKESIVRAEESIKVQTYLLEMLDANPVIEEFLDKLRGK
jgi:hypothetical protein